MRRTGTVTPQKTTPNLDKQKNAGPQNNTSSLHNGFTEVLRLQQRGGLNPNGLDNQKIPFPLITT